MSEQTEKLLAFFSLERLLPLSLSLLRILLILILALVASRLLRRAIPRLNALIVKRMGQRSQEDLGEREKRAQTLGSIITVAAVVATWIIALMMMLKEAGFDVGPLLAGAGVLGLAVGFGAQNLVRDVITGALMLLENQVRVGDVAVINGQGGLVQSINLRTIVLRGVDGTMHVFPNGTITSLSNMTHEYSYYVLDVGVAYKEDTDRVATVIAEVAAELQGDESFGPDILEPLEVLGVDKFADSAVVIKARIKTRPIKQWRVGRELNRRIKQKFDALGIEFPFPHRSLYTGEASKPLQVELLQSAPARRS